jgi:hypothetical protein
MGVELSSYVICVMYFCTKNLRYRLFSWKSIDITSEDYNYHVCTFYEFFTQGTEDERSGEIWCI